jgi:hypothetical protein
LNTAFSIRDDLDPDSNLTEESYTQKSKQSSSKTSTDAGNVISINLVQQKVHFSICDNLDPDSNVTEESDHHKKSTPRPQI